MSSFEAREDFLQRDKPAEMDDLICSRGPSPAGVLQSGNWTQIIRWPKRREPWVRGRRARASRKTLLQEPAGRTRTIESVRTPWPWSWPRTHHAVFSFFIPPMQPLFQLPSSIEVPPPPPRNSDTPIEPMPCPMTQFASWAGDIGIGRSRGLWRSAMRCSIIRAWLSDPVVGIE
jgi:hypothetical protein